MLKAQFHSHTNHVQSTEGNYSPQQLIDAAYRLGYDVLCITEHYNPNAKLPDYRKDPLQTYRDFKGYAEKKGILLLPGTELFLKEGEVLLINFNDDVTRYKSMKDLKKLPKNVAVIASHPYYKMKSCMGDELYQHHKLLDGVELSHYYTSFFNPNKKAIEFAQKHKKVVVGTGDVHRLIQLETSYSLVDAKKNPESVVQAIKKGKVKVVTEPLPFWKFSRITWWAVTVTLYLKLKEVFTK